MESTMNDRLNLWKARVFDVVLFILFLIAVAKLLYYEVWR
jgi:hypothetical protein